MDSYNIENYEGRLSLFFKNLIGVEDKILYNYLSKSCVENLKDTIFIVFYLRDTWGGKGNKMI